ncbi:TRAP transporter substrate-binding protein DctP [Marinobacterium sp. YM272]|uniref:TRAP transporter substrate-binding protein DctP n=1 Tax=Marinobacterium sp. YM272 TaxID=3421654 RepID=UPI003D7F6E2B
MKKMLSAVLSASLLCAASLPAQSETKILFNSFIPSGHLWNQSVLHPWLDEITEATDGRVTFDVPPTSLAPPQAQYDSVVKGIFDAAYVANVFVENRIKLPSIGLLPFTQVSVEANSQALWNTYDKYFAQADEFKDVHLLGFFVGMGGEILSAGDPILSSADLEGTKAYSLPGVTAKMLEDAGATVVSAPAVRSYELISSGTVDVFASLNAFDFEMFKAAQYAKHVTKIPGGTQAPVFSIFINKRVWNKISPEDQEIITKLAREPLAKLMGAYDVGMRESRVRLAAEGVEFHDAPEALVEDLKRSAQPTIDAWLATAAELGVDGQAALDYYVAEAQRIDAEIQKRDQ